ncbi:MAG: 2-oxoacid:acceptor oxidoreductase family protein, partial [Clostridiales bacterium]|nr:2-oxoacid:acceptor oxidoreductase family protein [Clostridiales bacterium]
YTVDAKRISEEALGRYFPNTPMLAAAVKVSGVIRQEQFIKDMEESFRHKFPGKPEIVNGNMKALRATLAEVV